MTAENASPRTENDSSPTAVIAGASGFIGRALFTPLQSWGYQVRTIVRSTSSGAHVSWNDPAGIAVLLDGADLLINLGGRSVGCRYNEGNRTLLRSHEVSRHRIVCLGADGVARSSIHTRAAAIQLGAHRRRRACHPIHR